MSPKSFSALALVALMLAATVALAASHDPRPDLTFMESSCPRSAPVLSGGSGDGLPSAAATRADAVAAVLQAERAELRWRWDAIEVLMIPRDGEAWTEPRDGDFDIVADDEGYIIEILIPDARGCPQAPQRLGSMQLVFNIAEP